MLFCNSLLLYFSTNNSPQDENVNETVLSAANLSGSPMPHYYTHCDGVLWAPAQPSYTTTNPPAYPQQFMGYRAQPFEHTKDCPRSR